MIFVFRLNPIQFHPLNIVDDGHWENETLSKKVETFKQQIIDSQPEDAIEDNHLL